MLNITSGVSLRAVRTAVIPLLFFERIHSLTKGQQVYLTDEENPDWFFCKAEPELLHCCSRVCATTAAAAKRIKTMIVGLADHCTDLLFLLGKSLLSDTLKHQRRFPQALVMLSCCSSPWEARVLASVTITLSFTQFTEFKESKLTSIRSSKISPIRHIGVR